MATNNDIRDDIALYEQISAGLQKIPMGYHHVGDTMKKIRYVHNDLNQNSRPTLTDREPTRKNHVYDLLPARKIFGTKSGINIGTRKSNCVYAADN